MNLNPETDLTFTRTLAAPRAILWDCWTTPDHIKHFFVPKPHSIHSCEIDLRVGGRFRVAMLAADGETHDVSGTYLEIVPQRRLVFSWAWRSTPERESRVTVRIEPDAAGTGCELELLHEQFFDQAAREGHEHGWTGSMLRLERWLGRPEPAA